MTAEILDNWVRCPIHGAKLVHIQEPIAEDIVVCPDCGMGGTYDQVVEKGMGPIVRFIPLRKLKELLKEAGYSANSSIAATNASSGSS
jgi:hypothetical protein